MPINLTKIYNHLLEIADLNEWQRKISLRRVFDRDFINSGEVKFRNKLITPTPKDGVATMDTLFSHLTTQMVDKVNRSREFEYDRSCRLHWVKHHIGEISADKISVFSVLEPEGNRTYIYDSEEKYVIVLQPLRNNTEYYLLSAHYLKGKDAQRDKMAKKYKRRLPQVL